MEVPLRAIGADPQESFHEWNVEVSHVKPVRIWSCYNYRLKLACKNSRWMYIRKELMVLSLIAGVDEWKDGLVQGRMKNW